MEFFHGTDIMAILLYKNRESTNPEAQIDIPVRVLHTVNPDDIPKNKNNFKIIFFHFSLTTFVTIHGYMLL